MKKYDQYKNSGVEWLGEIPEHWEITRLKNIFFESLKQNIDGKCKFNLSLLKDIGVIPFSEKGNKGNKSSLDTRNYRLVKKGDIVLNTTNVCIGSVGLSKYDGCMSSVMYIVLRPHIEIDIRYYDYIFKIRGFQKYLRRISNGILEVREYLDKTLFMAEKMVIPNINEQTTIANFLDDKTTKIDQSIAIKQKQIELLKERMQILIHKAVTRGLNENVKLKDSGVEWIGEIPEHWKIKRFRNTFKLGKGLTITKENLTDEGIFCVNYGEIHSKFGFEVNPEIHKLKCVHPDYLINNSSSLINEGDFVFADTSEDIQGSGNFTYLNSKEKVFAGYHTVIARPNNEIISRFIAYEFESLVFRSQIRAKVKGVKVFSITQSILKEISVLVPPKNEQLEIVCHLDNTTAKIATAISLKEQEIEKLKEYKMSLIDGVVTGKVKIC